MGAAAIVPAGGEDQSEEEFVRSEGEESEVCDEEEVLDELDVSVVERSSEDDDDRAHATQIRSASLSPAPAGRVCAGHTGCWH